ncbi:MAG: DUF433 domain-containing protein [Balneolaceae bacterium]|nr:DUF433 domain-containing protein [Balneolaceae bacterium]
MEIRHPDYNRISINPEICFGKPRIDGTRMPVSSILEYLSAGMSVEELLKEFPFLSKEDIMEALAFSARMMQDKFFPFEQAS